MTSNQCGVLFSDIDLRSFVYHLVHGHPEFAVVAFSQVHKFCGIHPQPFSKIFSWSIKAKFHVEPPWEGGTKAYINGLGHMTKMAATPIYGKNLETSFLEQKVL